MTAARALKATEQLVLLALAHLGDEGYGVTIRREIEHRAGRSVSTTAVYAALERLERDGLVEAHLSSPLPERGGRARRQFRLVAAGVGMLRRERDAIERMWDGLEANPLFQR